MRIGTEWKEIVAPLHVIMGQFWRTSRITIGAVILGVIASSLVTVSAPYVFSRLIDRITLGEDVETVLTGLVLYALLMGVALTLQHAVSYLAAMSAESLNFMAGTRFFERLVRKTGAFFVEHNPAEIQSAQSKGARALNVVVQLGLNAIAPGVAQLLLTLSVLGVALDPEMAAIVLVYGVVFIALAYFSTQAVDPYLDRAMAVEQENAKLVGNAVTSMETLRYFGSAVWMNERFVVGAREVFDNWRRFCAKRILYASFYGIALAALAARATTKLHASRFRRGRGGTSGIVLRDSPPRPPHHETITT
ncbi:ABC transporter transmembrane domain-containing protein [Cupriavidus sp. CV2]|uniref:ABC transporter transmembrane domain-containing protein n=1 Tax=Cupriavidus ulmosensis TaxID=3065913 RepID=UPI00296A9C63|nr:ABC transporter transmembrane domain-containing protein [Cupriavidus sp. CV2]MDW3684345.1 ABC transporter transmembrane domain-containing protein [Cupriavidus sp. CV2]